MRPIPSSNTSPLLTSALIRCFSSGAYGPKLPRASVQAETHTQTVVEVTEVRLVPVTRRRADLLKTIDPPTTTQHPQSTFFLSLKINHVFLRIFTLPILALLPNVAVHGVKPPGISGETAYWRGLISVEPFS